MLRDLRFVRGVCKASSLKAGAGTAAQQWSACGSRAGRWLWLAVYALVAAMILGTGPAQAAIVTWTGGGANGNWSNTDNWLGGTAPGSTSALTSTDIALFNSGVNNWGNSSGNPVVIDSTTQNLGGINFNASAGNYFIGSTSGNALLLTSGGSIQILGTYASSNGTETINAPLVVEGTNGTYTLADNSNNQGTLVIGGGISGGAAGNTVLTLGGSMTNNNNSTYSTVSGAISNGSATTLGVAMSGPGNWTLSGANTYTGATTISGGNLQISGPNGSISHSSGITIGNNATLTLTNTGAGVPAARIGSSVGIASYGGNFNFNNNAGSGLTYSEATGAVSLAAGQFNLYMNNNQNQSGNSQTLTLGGLNPSGLGTVTFSGNGFLPDATNNMYLVSGASGSGPGSGQIIGPWATVGNGSNGNNQSDYAVYDATGHVDGGRHCQHGRIGLDQRHQRLHRERRPEPGRQRHGGGAARQRQQRQPESLPVQPADGRPVGRRQRQLADPGHQRQSEPEHRGGGQAVCHRRPAERVHLRADRGQRRPADAGQVGQQRPVPQRAQHLQRRGGAESGLIYMNNPSAWAAAC